MEAADADFREGLRLLFIARDCRKQGERGGLLSTGAATLADSYRIQAMCLMMGESTPASGDLDAEVQLPRLGKVRGVARDENWEW